MNATLTHSERLEQLRIDVCDLRAASQNGDAKAQRHLNTAYRKLDELYWDMVEEMLSARVARESEHLDFTEDERLIIDVGLLDPDLVQNAGPDLTDKLLEELYTPGPSNHMYLSEWLEERYRRYLLTENLTAESDDKDIPLADVRKQVVTRLAPLFDGLPGVPAELARHVLLGTLDHQILSHNERLLTAPDRSMFLRRVRLRQLRSQVLEKARARARTPAILKLFDMFDDFYARAWHEVYRRFEEGEDIQEDLAQDATLTALQEKAVRYLVSELRFVKTLMPLGGLAGGITRTCAVLLDNQPRVTKADTHNGLALAMSADREFSVNPLVLIAPFQGRGIYEWDRDSLVVSLRPVESAEDSVANAAANYHMLTDTFHQEGRLRKAFEDEFAGAKFQQEFQQDYRAWICQVAHGREDNMDPGKLDFFLQHIGPDCTAPLAPGNLRTLGPQAREGVRKRLSRQIAITPEDWNLQYRLGVLHWQDGNLAEATTLFGAAARLHPEEGKLLFCLALLLHAQDETKKAQAMRERCISIAPDTLWAAYARLWNAGRIFS